jgi:hypothetical protein
MSRLIGRLSQLQWVLWTALTVAVLYGLTSLPA